MNEIKQAFDIIKYIYSIEITLGDFTFTIMNAAVFFLLSSVLIFFIFRLFR